MSAPGKKSHVVLVEGRNRRLPELARGGSRRLWTILLLLMFGGSVVTAVAGGAVFNIGGWDRFFGFWASAASPELSPAFLHLTLEATLTTLAYAMLGASLSTALGSAAGVLASRVPWTADRRSLRWLVVGGSRGFLSLPRGIHEIVWGLLLLNILGADPWVAILAIGLPYGAITAKVFAEILDETPQAPYLTLRAAGAPRMAALFYGVGPLAFRDMISYAFYRFECSIRAAAILGLIGAGGLGYELTLSFRTLRYDEMWTLIYALICLSGLADLWSSAIRRRLSGPAPAGDSRGRLLGMSIPLWLGLCGLMYWKLSLSVSTLWTGRAVEQVGQVLGQMWPPRLPGGNWGTVIRASLETLQMSTVAIAIAATGGMIASALIIANVPGDSRPGTLWQLVSRLSMKALLLLFRAIPPNVWGLVLLFMMFPGTLPGAVALGIYNLGILGRLMSEAAENLDERPRRSLSAAGAGGAASFLYGVAPQLASRYVALSLYRWEVTTRETVIVGLVGAGGLGRLLAESLAAFDFGRVAGVLIALILTALFVDLVSGLARQAFRQ